jgi:putative aldouronate transport system substrate-binding protein
VNADWDSYLQELENIGLSHYLKVKQQIYDRYDSAE